MKKQIVNTVYQETLFNVFPYKLPAFPKVTLTDATIKQLHYHNTFEIGYCYSGAGECISEIGNQKFKKGDAEFFFPSQPHLSRSNSIDKSIWDFSYFNISDVFSGHGFDLPLWESLAETQNGLCGIIKHEEHPEICNCINRILNISHSNEKNKVLKCRILIAELLVHVTEYNKDSIDDEITIKPNKKLSKLMPAISYIKHHYNVPIKLKELADMCSMSTSTFRENFTSAMGVSPQEFLISTKMRFARYHLENSTKTIQEICALSGFKDTANFYKQFSKRFGISPTEYRNSLTK